MISLLLLEIAIVFKQKWIKMAVKDSLTYITIMSSLHFEEEKENISEPDQPIQYPDFFDDTDFINPYLW